MSKQMEKLKEVKKSKRVQWPTEANLHQLKIFEPEDCPYKVGLEAPCDPQSMVSNSNMVVSEGRSYINPSPSTEKVVPYIPLVPWRTPREINLSSKWHVAAGEDSEERWVQMQRILRELNSSRYSTFQLGSLNAYHYFLDHIVAHYGHSPSISLDVDDQYIDDSKTPVVPITSTEEAGKMDLPPDELSALAICFNSQPPNLPQNPSTSEFFVLSRSNSLPSPKPSNCEQFNLTTLQDQGDPSVATTMTTLKELCGLIDPELLIKLLNNPKLTEKLIHELRLSSSSTNGTSELKDIELPLPQQNSHQSFLINKSTLTSIPANFGTEAIHRPLMVKQSSAPLSKTMANATDAETGIASGRKPFEQSLHLLNSTPVLLAQESTSKNIQQANVEHEALPRSVTQQLAATGNIRTCIGPNVMTTSVPLLSLTSDLPGKNSSREYCQKSDTGIGSVKTVLTSSVTLSRSTPDVLGEKSLVTAECASFRFAPSLSSLVQPSRLNFQSKERLPTAPQASSFSLMTTSVSAPKDLNYLRSLVRQHGGANNSGDAKVSQYQKPDHYLQTQKSGLKHQKPCKFHNSSKGCRNGSSCRFLHDMRPLSSTSDSVLEAPGAKRMKLVVEVHQEG